MRVWWYQCCTEMAYFQIAPRNNSVRSSAIDKQYWRDFCSNVFGEGIFPDTAATNRLYGATDIAGASPCHSPRVTLSLHCTALPGAPCQATRPLLLVPGWGLWSGVTRGWWCACGVPCRVAESSLQRVPGPLEAGVQAQLHCGGAPASSSPATTAGTAWTSGAARPQGPA